MRSAALTLLKKNLKKVIEKLPPFPFLKPETRKKPKRNGTGKKLFGAKNPRPTPSFTEAIFLKTEEEGLENEER